MRNIEKSGRGRERLLVLLKRNKAHTRLKREAGLKDNTGENQTETCTARRKKQR